MQQFKTQWSQKLRKEKLCIAPYMQFDGQKHEQQSSGPGFAICQRIIHLYDGKLTIESKVGEKTLVKVHLYGKPVQ